jgi:dTMP kinase
LFGRGGGLDRIEADEVDALVARRQAFLQIAAREPERCVVIEASADQADVAAAIRAAVEARLIRPAGEGR